MSNDDFLFLQKVQGEPVSDETQEAIEFADFDNGLPESVDGVQIEDGLAPYSPDDAPSRISSPIDLSRVYYIGGPMKGYPDHNFPAFREAAEILRYTGLKIVSPTEVNLDAYEFAKQHGDGNEAPYPLHFVAADILEMVTKCNGLILLSGWPRSRGARIELGIALDLEWPIWFYNNYQLTFMGGNYDG
jgi:hypothetical protein